MAVDAKTLELRELVLKKYRYIDRKWDLVFWVTAAFVVGAAADITKQLFAGDWDFSPWADAAVAGTTVSRVAATRMRRSRRLMSVQPP